METGASSSPSVSCSCCLLSTHVGVLGATLLVPFPPTQLYAAASLGLVAVHVLASLRVAGGSAEDLRAIASVPGYVARKAKLVPEVVAASRVGQAWVRTQR